MQFNPLLVSMPQYPFAQLAQLRKQLVDAGKKVYDFTKGDPIEPTPELIRNALSAKIPAISQYPAVKGLPELRQAAAAYLARSFDVTVDFETQILQSNGSKEAIYNLLPILIGSDSPKRTIIASVPGYPVLERSAAMNNIELYPVELTPENQFLLELDSLPPEVLRRTAVAWVNYPNNPTGAVCDRSYFERQVKTAKKYDILLCSDECYVDLYLNSTPHPSVLEVTTDGVVAFFSCSKRSGMTGYRTGFMAGDAEVLKLYLRARDAMGTETSVFVQHAAIASWSDDTHVEERRSIFRQKRALFVEFFQKKNIEFLDAPATFYLWAKVPGNQTAQQYAAKLREVGILVTPGDFFGGTASAQWMRVALVPSVAECRDAIQLWDKV